MTSGSAWTRRGAVGGVAAALSYGAARAADPDPAPPPMVTPDHGAFLETAFDQARRVSVPVYVNGKGPFPFVVDTGANRSVVSTELAVMCDLSPAGMAPVHGIVAEAQAKLVRVASLRTGDVVSRGMSLPMMPQAELGADGLLGLDMFHNRRIVLDFKDRGFQIAPSGGVQVSQGPGSRAPSAGAPVTVPARYQSGQLVILDAEVLGRPITAFLDSGSQVTVANRYLRDLIFQARPDLERQVIRSELISATGQTAPAEFAPLPALRIGGQDLSSPLIAFSDLHIFDLWDLRRRPTILIGVDILRHFDRVAFDFGRKEITFWASSLQHSGPRRP